MSLKFKGNKTVSDVLNLSKKGKSAQSLLQKRSLQEVSKEDRSKALYQNDIQKLNSQKKEEQEKMQLKKDIEDNNKKSQVQELNKTPSEISFDMIRKKRITRKVEEQLKSTYRQKVEKFNSGLSSLPEHFDIPKVGPG